MAGYNRVIMIGNLTRDPEYKQLASGQAVCRLGLATNRQFKNRQTGDMVQEVCYVDIDVWGAQAESCRQYLNKGRSVLIEGRLKLDTWQDQDGKNRSKHTIVADRVTFLSSGQTDEFSAATSSPTASSGFANENSSSTPESVRKMEESDLGQEIMGKIDELKNKAAEVTPATKPVEQSVAAAKPAEKDEKKSEVAVPEEALAKSGAIDFKDEPPFQDDLPF